MSAAERTTQAARLEGAFNARSRGPELPASLDAARELYAIVSSAETAGSFDSTRIIAETLLRFAEAAVAAERRRLVLDTAAALKGATEALERKLRAELAPAIALAEKMVQSVDG